MRRLENQPSAAARFALKQCARVTVRSNEAGGIHDPAIHQFLKPALGEGIENGGAPQGMEIAVGIEPKLRGPVEAVGQLLASVAERLEVANGVGVLQHGSFGREPYAAFWRLAPAIEWQMGREAVRGTV